MSTISSLSPALAQPRITLGAYERNAKVYGPAVASVIGAADAMADAATSTARFSTDALQRFSTAIGEGVDGAMQVAAGALELGEGVVDSVEDAGMSALNTLADAGEAVVDGLGDVASNVASYLLFAGQVVGNVLDSTV